jgi:imidazoleglycerol phosphate dehydratase HisB
MRQSQIKRETKETKINVSLPLLSKKNAAKKEIKFCTNINKKFFINGSDLFY